MAANSFVEAFRPHLGSLLVGTFSLLAAGMTVGINMVDQGEAERAAWVKTFNEKRLDYLLDTAPTYSGLLRQSRALYGLYAANEANYCVVFARQRQLEQSLIAAKVIERGLNETSTAGNVLLYKGGFADKVRAAADSNLPIAADAREYLDILAALQSMGANTSPPVKAFQESLDKFENETIERSQIYFPDEVKEERSTLLQGDYILIAFENFFDRGEGCADASFRPMITARENHFWTDTQSAVSRMAAPLRSGTEQRVQ